MDIVLDMWKTCQHDCFLNDDVFHLCVSVNSPPRVVLVYYNKLKEGSNFIFCNC